MTDGKQKRDTALFALYTAGMLFVLFFRQRSLAGMPYYEQLRMNLNLVPLRTIRLYLRLLRRNSVGDTRLVRRAVVNLAGNVLLFIPLGWFLPRQFPKLGKFRKMIPAVAGVVTLIELIQLVLLVGSCDIDDLILNTFGAAIGYGLNALRIRRKKET